MDLSTKKSGSVIVTKDEIKDIFNNHYMQFKKKTGGDHSWRVDKRTDFGGGFSDIYKIKNSVGEKGILKVLSAKRTVNNGENIEASKIFSIAYNEIFTMRLFTLLEDESEANASTLNGYYEYRTTYKKEDGTEADDWIFFIIMPEYETLGNCRLSSEKDIYDIALSILKTLRVLNERVNYIDLYDCFKREGILSFNPDFLSEKDLENYKNFRRVLHNDIKPDNILKKIMGNDYVTVLADFGAVCFMDDDGKAIVRYGSKPYFDPQLIRNRGVIKNGATNSDIYSLGITLLSLFYIIGNLPFTKISRYTSKFADYGDKFKEEAEKDKNSLNPDVLQKPEFISDLFWKIIMKMISKFEWDRFSDVNQAISALTDRVVVSRISEENFPPEIIAKTSLWNLLHENKISELNKVIVDEYERQKEEETENYLFTVLFAFVYACGIKEDDNAEANIKNVKSLLDPYMDDGRDGAWFVYDIIVMLAKKKGIFSGNSETVIDARKNLKHLCNVGFLPAVYFYMSLTVQGEPEYDESSEYILKKLDNLLEYPYIPGVRLYRDVLKRNPCLLNLDDETKEKKLDIIRMEFKDDISDYLAIVKYLLENDSK